jgi:hypothetical protein
MSKDLILDGVSVSRAFLEGYKTEGEFLKAVNDDKTYQHLFEGEGRTVKLKELYALAQPKKEAEKKVDKPE